MPKTINRDEVRKLLDQGVQLVEVLPIDEYQEDHLPGAISLPLRRIEGEGVTILDRNQPAIVYCWDVS